mmetsp:Transcript_28939/g.43709  ORF Transcript_28939/g.43709 Transcript_28939/m.43709 type:complete len:363 (+) Transcript_28939:110-1198(+)
MALTTLFILFVCCRDSSGLQVSSRTSNGNFLPKLSFHNNMGKSAIFHRLNSGPFWDGDDVRWITRQRRRLTRFRQASSSPVRESLLVINASIYLWQVLTTIRHLRLKFPAYWTNRSYSMIFDSVFDGTQTVGPFTSDFMFSSMAAMRQPHRFLTSGFLHASIMHLGLNLYVLRQLPTWIESGLGWALMITTYLLGIIGGSYFHGKLIHDNMMICVGSQGGVAALAGLSFIALTKMKKKSLTAKTFRSICILFVLGLILPGMSNTTSFGGFLSGCLMGILFSPGYRRSYGQRRKNAIEVDSVPPDYRRAMGFGMMPNERPPLKLRIFWALALSCLLSFPELRHAPSMVLRGVLNPGYLSGWKD